MSELREHSRVLGVLPWRRPTDAEALEVEPIIRALRQHHGKADAKLVQRAYEMARGGHANQFRESGEAFISHPLNVARLLAEKGFDPTTVAAALLHDVVEDTSVGLEEVEAEFGSEIANIVDGVTKLDRLDFNTKEAQQAATLRKMLVAMASDIRVLVIKVADRLHNMRTIEHLDEARRRRISQETIDIYAPLAHRLGMQEFKWQLEDIAFKTLHPKRYAEIEQLVAERGPELTAFTDQVVEIASKHLASAKISATVTGRPKHFYSIYEKMVVGGREFNEIYDLVGIRVIVKSVRDCYAALGALHAIWAPVSGRFKDYIAMPKFNLYQSLHTTVIGPEGRPVEIQIRTEEMHRTAEWGLAAHWQYKDEKRGMPSERERLWLKSMLEWQSDSDSPQDFLESLKFDLYQDAVFVFTPRGDVIELPQGATPIDFAYAIHTEVGHRCIGARVDGRLVPLGSPLESGSTVEIFTSGPSGGGPSQDWLRLVKTPKARNKIRQWFSRERREDAIESGSRQVADALRREGLQGGLRSLTDEIASVATDMNYASTEAMFAAVGEGHVAAQSIATRLARKASPRSEVDELAAGAVVTSSRKTDFTSPGVRVEGLDDVWCRLARDCNPIPGDEIVGFVTRGRGVSVHRADCANAQMLQSGPDRGRIVDVSWDPTVTTQFVLAVQVEALDRSGLLRDTTAALTRHHVNIVSCNTHTGGDRIAILRFEFELVDTSHLDQILGSIRSVEGVFDVYRVMPGSERQ